MLNLPLSVVDLLLQIQQKSLQTPSSPQALANMPGFNWTLPPSMTLLLIQLSQIVNLGTTRGVDALFTLHHYFSPSQENFCCFDF